MNVVLWIVQVLLAAAFGMSGVMKSTMPILELALQVPWADDVPVAFVRFIGIVELTGAVGLILPALTRIKPELTPLAALGILTVMLLAMLFHISRGEFGVLPINLVLGAMAAFIAWGRRRVPIPAR